MSNATAAARKNPLEDLAFAGAIVFASASSVTSEPKITNAYGLEWPEINLTRSDAAIGLEGVRTEFEIERVTASVPIVTAVAKTSQAAVPAWKAETYASINSLASLSLGWDGSQNAVASRDAVRLALSIIREWPSALPNPEVDVLSDGTIVLEVFDEGGMAVASVEARADGSTAYVVARGTDIVLSKCEVVSSPSGIGSVLGTIRDNID
ncbi:MAG: hypothetical protein AAGF25_12355 [Pseudomonadota bacterium]